MQSSFIPTLQKFQFTASSQGPSDLYTPPLTKSHIFMKTCKQSSPASGLSFPQQKSCLQTQALTRSQSTQSSHVVENICNQIKYLIEGNLRSTSSQSFMTDLVRQSIIPMLIKMFFQNSKTDNSIGQSFGCPKQQLKDITNNFGAKMKAWKTQTFNEEQKTVGLCNTAKSDFIRNTQMEEQYNLENQSNISEKNQIPQFGLNQSSQLLTQQQRLTKTLCISILLLKTLVVKKTFAFQKIKLFGKLKQKKLIQFIDFVKQAHVKKCISKFAENKLQTSKQMFVLRIAQQSKKLNQKQMKLSGQVIGKILKNRLKSYFTLFRKNAFSENKWMNQWVRYAALRSPLTLKTSIWRLKQFITSQNEQISPHQQKKDNTNEKIDQPKALDANLSQINSQSQSEESISSNQFDKMFEDEEEDLSQASKRPSLQIMAKENNQNTNILESLISEKRAYEQDEYLRTISEDEQENSSVYQ